MGLFNKKELKRIEELEAQLEELGALEYSQVRQKCEQISKQCEKITQEYQVLETKVAKANAEIQSKKQELDDIMLDLEMSDFGLYTPKYQCMTSEEYAEKIKVNRTKQKELIKVKRALYYYDNWTLDGSKSKGRAMNNDNMKMYLRAFNNECDVLISKAKFNNMDKIASQIEASATALNKLNVRAKISAKPEYIKLKLEELSLVYEHAVKKQEEKEANRAAREAEREQQKLLKEIEAARAKINKEKTHYEKAKEKLLLQLSQADESKKEELTQKLQELESTLEEISKNLADVDYREANQRAGYVYVISNIGSFGEGIYKIGMTRRLDPQDRVDELGDASVPFRFDVHAMIFSDDAPALESALHQAFAENKVNMVNGRKEFFEVSLDEIERVIKRNHDKSIEFIKTSDAEQYRESLKMRKHA